MGSGVWKAGSGSILTVTQQLGEDPMYIVNKIL